MCSFSNLKLFSINIDDWPLRWKIWNNGDEINNVVNCCLNKPITVMLAVSAKAKNVGVTVTSQRYVPLSLVETDSSTTLTWSDAVILNKNKHWHEMSALQSEINESLDGVSVSTSFGQSQLVSVSTSSKFPSLDESQSWYPVNFPVSMSLGLDICKISQSRWVSVLTSIKFFSLYESRSQQIFRYQSQTKFTGLVLYSLDNFCFSLDVFLVSVSTLRFRKFQSRSRQWDSDLFSLGLDDSNLVSLIPEAW